MPLGRLRDNQYGLLSSARRLLRRAHTANSNGNQYSNSLKLPTTGFPLRPDHARALQYEDSSKLYQKQRTGLRRFGEEFILHDGPPYANGDLHMGHALNKILKDIIVRKKILEGRRVRFIPGWDCHGLPIEIKALQKHQSSESTQESLEAGDNKTPSRIREIAHQLASETVSIQSSQFQKMAICADWHSPYRTFDLSYETAQLSIFSNMVEKNLIYRAKKPVYWSPSSRTALAESELEYRDDHVSHSAYVSFPLTQMSSDSFADCGVANVHLLIWTTTPWTLPANRAIAINPDIQYILLEVDQGKKHYIVASDLADKVRSYFPDITTARVISSSFSGARLIGLMYNDALGKLEERRVIAASYVSADSGTGLVHTAPGHGQEDYLACKALNDPIEPYSPVDAAGNYTQDVGIDSLVGLNVQAEGSKKVIDLLRGHGHLLAVEKYKHKYPYDWRTKKPIIVRATPQFFANLSSTKIEALSAIEKVSMIPNAGRSRMASFVQGRDEWCISRQRSWGVPIPALYSPSGDLMMNKESIAHIITVLRSRGMNAWFDSDPTPDSWKDWVPPDLRKGSKWTRGRETLDVWFDSGCSWATLQESPEILQPSPVVADIYLEGTDQHRGWFQSSLLTSVATRNIAPYKCVITHGFVLDDKGRKMSKSIGNVVDPLLIIGGRPATTPAVIESAVIDKKLRKQLERTAREQAAEVKALGADVLRLWVAQSDYTADVSVSPAILSHVAESLRKFRTTLRFLIGNLQDYDPRRDVLEVGGDYGAIDHYAFCMSTKFRHEAEVSFAAYTFNKVVASMNQYTNAFLSSFYFDTLKDRLYADVAEGDSRRSAQKALFTILKDYLLVLAPICPLLVGEVWHHLPQIIKCDFADIYESDWHATRNSYDTKHQMTIDQWAPAMRLRDQVNKKLDSARTSKSITSSLQAGLTLVLPETFVLPLPVQELPNFFIVSEVQCERGQDLDITVKKAEGQKCPRCWVYASPAEDVLCNRCEAVIK